MSAYSVKARPGGGGGEGAGKAAGINIAKIYYLAAFAVVLMGRLSHKKMYFGVFGGSNFCGPYG